MCNFIQEKVNKMYSVIMNAYHYVNILIFSDGKNRFDERSEKPVYFARNLFLNYESNHRVRWFSAFLETDWFSFLLRPVAGRYRYHRKVTISVLSQRSFLPRNFVLFSCQTTFSIDLQVGLASIRTKLHRKRLALCPQRWIDSAQGR